MKTEDSILQSFARGYYTPSFYRLVVNTIYDLADLKELEKERLPFSTFFHEYLHFLQDVSTSFGLMNSMMILNEIKYFNSYARNQQDTFRIPLPLNDNPIVDTAREMRMVYMGPVIKNDWQNVKFVKKVESHVNVPPPFAEKLKKIVVGFELPDGSIEEVDLGGLAVVEGMAHIAQSHFYSEVEHDSIPYKLAQLAVNHIYPEFAKNDLYIFALCDACLMTYHPGLTLFEFLEGVKYDGKIPTEADEIYDMVFSSITGNGKSILSIFCDSSNQAQIGLTDYFTTDLHNNEKDWMIAILERAKQLRLKQPTFLLDLLKQEKANSIYFQQILRELGSPLIQNIDSEAHIFIPQGFENIPLRIDIFPAINEIFKVFDSGQSKCGLIDYCKKSENGDITDQRCKTEPWTRSNDSQLCGFAVLWRMWGLTETKPLKNELP